MQYKNERDQLVEHGIKMVEQNLIKGSGGNLSIYIPEDKRVLITPSGLDYYKVTPRDIVVMNLDGTVVEGERKPSSEYQMHLIFYKKREDIRAVVHCHSIFASTIATLGWDIPGAYYLIGVAGGENVRCAEYATYGTEDLAEKAFNAMKDRYAVLLANHGMLTGGSSLAHAYGKAEDLELCAEIFYRAKLLDNPKIIETSEIYNLVEKFSGGYRPKEKE